jgi:hypothetical protein
VLAAAGLLDGHRATTCWSRLKSLQRTRPQVDWVRGQRYVQDGKITTTAGVTSGVFGALRLVPQLAGPAGAQRAGRELGYPGWSLDGPAGIPAAPFEVYATSFAARTVPIAAGRTVTTRHGLRLIAAPADAAAPRVDRLIVPGARNLGQAGPLCWWLHLQAPQG